MNFMLRYYSCQRISHWRREVIEIRQLNVAQKLNSNNTVELLTSAAILPIPYMQRFYEYTFNIFPFTAPSMLNM
jgi:hypothetical protein